MLRFILGRSGSGKTKMIHTLLCEQAKAGIPKQMLLVPEQYSFESERTILRRMGAKDARNVEISSFTRLTDLVFRQTGGLAGRRLDDGGRCILMSLALEQVKDQLTLYKRQSDQMELVTLMLSALSEFKMCAVTPSELRAAADTMEEGSLRQKAHETALIVEAYEALVAQSYIDPLDDLTRLANVLQEYPFFEGYTVMLDSFSGFTMQEMKVLEWILRQAKDVYISLCADGVQGRDDGIALFSPVQKTIHQLTRMAKGNHIEVAPPVYLTQPGRFEGDGLKVLEQSVFRNDKLVWEEETEDVHIYNAADLYDEADFVARTVRRLVMQDRYRYRDFAVIARTTEAYRGILDTAFEKYEIPYFMDKPEAIDAKPLMNLVLTAFDIVHSSFASDDIFRYLKTGLAGLSTEEISVLENYVLLWDIRGKRWQQEFTFHPRGFSEELRESDAQELHCINTLRERVVVPLVHFAERLHSACGEDMARAAYLLLEEVGVAQHLKKLAADLRQSAEPDLAEEQLRLWDMLMGVLDQTALVLKKQAVTSKRYAGLLKLVIDAGNIAFIPQGLDEVTVGGADRTRPAQPKVVFVIGAAEGDFPRSPVAAGVFSDAERRFLISKGLPMYDPLENLAVQERFLAYTVMTSPSQKLYLSWASTTASGGAKTPSAIIRETKRILPKVRVADIYSEDQRDLVWARQPAFEMTARLWRTGSRFSESLKSYFNGKEEYAARMQALNRASNGFSAVFRNTEKSKRLFGANMRLSASQVEKYYLCRFQYFCQYGLRAKERKPAAFDALEYGSLMHFLLERMLKKHADGLAVLGQKEMKQEIDMLLEQYVETKLGGWEDKTPRFRFQFSRLAATAEILIRHIAAEFVQSEFQPQDYELTIAEEGDVRPLVLGLPDGGTVTIEGKVDRVDVMQKNGVSYVRIIDYKTGTKEFKLSDILYGLNMQMLIYMAAIWQNGEPRYGKVLPAGILYMPASRPVISVQRDTAEEKIEAEMNKKLRMNGLVLDDAQVISGMEAKAQGVFIPVALKDGAPAKLDSVANLAQMGTIVKRIEKQIADMACTLQQGDVSPLPAAGEYDACGWCPYASVCGHEKDSANVTVEKWDRGKVLEELAKESER